MQYLINMQLGQEYFAYTLKKRSTICIYLTYQVFKGRERIISRANLAEHLLLDLFSDM